MRFFVLKYLLISVGSMPIVQMSLSSSLSNKFN